jgi:hypothetical protein
MAKKHNKYNVKPKVYAKSIEVFESLPALSRDDKKVNIVPLSQYDPTEADRIAQKLPEPQEVPEGYEPHIAHKMKNLTQYKGWTREGFRKSVGNLPRKRSMAKAIKKTNKEKLGSVPAEVPGPDSNIPPILGGPGESRYRHMRSVLTDREFELFSETWRRWFSDHADHRLTEDEDDVTTICWEAVIQARMRAIQTYDPDKYNDRAYHESCTRMQRARENLDAIRKDRNKQKAGGGHTQNVSIAVLAGQVDPKFQQAKMVANDSESDDFFASTLTSTQNPMALDGTLTANAMPRLGEVPSEGFAEINSEEGDE